MKSVQVAAYDSASAHKYTDLQVMRSGAGGYIGTEYEYIDKDSGYTIAEPGSRDSNYFPTEELANYALAQLIQLDMGNGIPDIGVWEMRMTHELKINVFYRRNP